MKKSNKKVPKTHLPKYRWGTKTTTLSNGNEESMYDAGPEGNSATSSLYNDKRTKSQKTGTAAGYATAAAGTLGNYAAVANNPNLNSAQRTTAYGQSANQTVNAVIGAVPVIGQYYALADGAANAVTDMTTSSNINPETHKKSYKQGTDAVAGELLTPTHESQINAVTDLANGKGDVGSGIAAVLGASSIYNAAKGSGIFGGKDEYAENEKLIAAENQKQQDLANQQQAAYQQQQNDYINNAIQAGMANYQQQPKGASIQYAMGGMNMQPNAEIEKEENVVAPNGGFLQADGPSHEQGGIPVALPGNSMIFSDKLKLGKKTFADLNKVNNTNKEDKVLESNRYGNTSKRTAELMKMAKNKNSEELFNTQESLKQSKVEAYAKKLGVTLPQTSQTPQQEFAMGGVKLPMYPYGTITPEQYKQAQTDSMTLYNAGLKSNKIPAYEYPGAREAAARLTGLNNRTPTPIKGQFYGQQPDYTGSYHTEFKKPTMIPYREASLEDSKKVPVVNHPNYNQYIPGIEKSVQLGNIEQYEHGGRKLPKYEFGKLTPEEEGEDLEAVWKKSSAKIDAQHNWNSNDETTRPGYKKETNWKNTLGQVGNFAAQNAGNIYDLINRKKNEVEKYDRLKPSYLDPTASLRDAQMQANRAEYNVRGASGGNAGTYLSNRVALNAQNTINKDRIRKEYANINAGISNQIGQYNNELSRAEVIANAQNRAVNDNIRRQAIGSLGSNFGQASLANKKGEMDQNTLDLMMKYYDTPEFQRLMKENKFKK
jgi:hypothetical protein